MDLTQTHFEAQSPPKGFSWPCAVLSAIHLEIREFGPTSNSIELELVIYRLCTRSTISGPTISAYGQGNAYFPFWPFSGLFSSGKFFSVSTKALETDLTTQIEEKLTRIKREMLQCSDRLSTPDRRDWDLFYFTLDIQMFIKCLLRKVDNFLEPVECWRNVH